MPEVAIGQCMYVSIHAHSEVCESLRSPVPCTCWCCTSASRERNGREPGLVMYCVSVKLHREGCCGLAEVNMWFPFGWLTKQPIPMATSCPTNPHYQSGCSFLHSHHCCKSCHQIHLHQSLGFPRGLQCFALYGCSRSLQSQASDGNL